MKRSPLDPLLRDVCAHLGAMPDLSHAQRLRVAIDTIEALTGCTPRVRAVRAAVFSRSALYHLGGAMLPATLGEAQQFSEQCRGGFVELHCDTQPHLILVVDEIMLELAHSAQWNDRGVLVRPFASPLPRTSTWVVNGRPFGVAIAYEYADVVTSPPARSPTTNAATDRLIPLFASQRVA